MQKYAFRKSCFLNFLLISGLQIYISAKRSRFLCIPPENFRFHGSEER